MKFASKGYKSQSQSKLVEYNNTTLKRDSALFATQPNLEKPILH
jgi:hypothetical protein